MVKQRSRKILYVGGKKTQKKNKNTKNTKLNENHSFYEQVLKDFNIVDNAYLRYKNGIVKSSKQIGKGQLISKTQNKKKSELTLEQKKIGMIDRKTASLVKRLNKYGKRYPLNELRGDIPKHIWKIVLDLYSTHDFINDNNTALNYTKRELQIYIDGYEEMIESFLPGSDATILEKEGDALLMYNHFRNLAMDEKENDWFNFLDKILEYADFKDNKVHNILLKKGRESLKSYKYMLKVFVEHGKDVFVYLENEARKKDDINKTEDKEELKKFVDKRKEYQKYDEILDKKLISSDLTDEVDKYW